MSLNTVTLTFEVQDAGDDAASGAVTIAPTSVVTAAGQTVVSQEPVVRQMSSGTASVQLVACDNGGTSPAAGFWAYQITLPGGQPGLYLVNFAGGATQRFDDLAAVTALTTYGPAAASAAVDGGTLTEYLAPAVVSLTDAVTIGVNAAKGNDFRVTLGGNRTMGAPGSAVDGQHLLFQVAQPDTGGPFTLSWASAYDFGGGSAPALSSTASAVDLVAFVWNAAKGKALCLGSATGF
jgi:hypothetical protein